MRVFIGLIGGLLLIVLLVVMSVAGRGVDTASKMADQTVFNASKNVWSYEQFFKQYESYKSYDAQILIAQKSLDELKASGVTSGQAFEALVLEITGARQMKNRIATDYNAASKISYQAFWKDKGLPETLEP
jgi:hypothetical protein